jgi:hypothetical protein
MNERAKITASHHSRQAVVYLRQSSPAQVEHNRESTERQYALATKARELGWPDDLSSSTRTSVSLAPARSRAPALRASPLRSPSPALGSFLGSRCYASLATTPTGTASSISPG